MTSFFINRPIFAWVLALGVMLAGALAVVRLPIAQYPAIAPPAISVSATYPGASSRTLEESVTQVIEQRMTGLEGLRYISSSSDSNGSASVELTFEPGTNPDLAQVQVQNKLQLAMPQLPQEVQRQGVRVSKAGRNFLLIAAFVSADGSMTRNDISDYVASNLLDPMSRVPGVGDIQVFGAQYAMRIWLDPDKLAGFRLTALDVRDAVVAQNAQVSAGQFGAAPSIEGQALNATITAQTRLQRPEQFKQILLRVQPDGGAVRLGDVARVELAGESFEVESWINGKPTSGMGIRLAVGANALATADAVKQRLQELSASFPQGLTIAYPVDTTPFIEISIKEVVVTLIEAVVLVFIVMLVFLQSLRATLIPTLAVPVVLLGTFGVLALFGYSINTLTMFAMVLAIGLLVDDAIVVVENVERVMSEEGLDAKAAAKQSMRQITGALVGIALVLSAVFLPMAFFPGSVGVIYRQFAVTIVSAMVLSLFVAVVFTPALCATLLKPGHGPRTRGPAGWFNRGFKRLQDGYAGAVGGLLRGKLVSLAVFGMIVVGMVVLLGRMPKGFLPSEDQGQLNVQVMLAPGATQEQTREVMQRVTDYLINDEKDAVQTVMAISGFGFGGRGQNTGTAFVRLRPWDQRTTARLSSREVARRATRALASVRTATIFVAEPPAISELGNVAGFQLQLQDRGGVGRDLLVAAKEQVVAAAQQDPRLTKVREGGLEARAEYKIDVDHEKAAALGLSLTEINATLGMTWGAAYVNDFLDNGRTKRVYLQADAPYRMQPEDIGRWFVRNRAGQMVPFSAFASGRWMYGAPKVDRFNGFSTIAIQGEPAAGISSGEALAAMDALVAQLPTGIGGEWAGLAYEERQSGSSTTLLYGLSLLVVFLCLAALYESWTIPVAVMLVVPVGVFGAVVANLLGGQANDVYFQIALLATIGLSAKNAILIVEFAKELTEAGQAPVPAVIEAARQRLRPILMTSFAFVLGVLPLATASGAGAGAQNAIGIAVIGGVIASTVIGILIVPVFFVVITQLRRNPAHTLQVAKTAD